MFILYYFTYFVRKNIILYDNHQTFFSLNTLLSRKYKVKGINLDRKFYLCTAISDNIKTER